MKRQRHLIVAVIALLLSLGLSPAAHAVNITGLSIQDVSSELVTNLDRDSTFIINGSGLNINGPGTHSTAPDGPGGAGNGTMWLNTGTSNCCGGTSYVNSPGAGQDDMPEVTIDLGARYNLESIRIWNYNESGAFTSRGANGVDLLTSVDGVTFAPHSSINLAQAPGVNNVDFSETFSLSGEARFVKLDITSTHGGGNGFVGLSEVQVAGSPLSFPVTGVTIADVSSEIVGFSRNVVRLVDGSGLNPLNETHTDAPENNMWLNNGTGRAGPQDSSPFVTFDLGAPVALDSIQIWNYNEFQSARPELNGRGVNEFEVLVGNSASGPFQSLGVFALAQSFGETDLDFSELFQTPTGPVQFVRFDILSNHNGAQFPDALNGVDSNFVGLSEVRFFERPVPEPSTLGLLLLAAGGVMRRRRSATRE